MACEWTIRFDQPVKASSADLGKQQKSKARAVRDSISAFAVNDMRLANQYGGVSTSGREFVSRFVLSEDFFGNLMEHRSEEHTSELQSLMRISYAAFCLQINTHLHARP